MTAVQEDTRIHEQIVELAQRSGIPYKFGSGYRRGAVTRSGNVSHHASGKAVDFMGPDQDQLAEFFMGFPTLEVFHYSTKTGKWYGSSKGKAVNPDTHRQLVEDHKDHLHVAMGPEQVGPGSILDNLRKGLAAISPGLQAAAGPLGRFLPTPGNVTDALTNVGTGIYSIAQSAMSVGRVADAITRMFLPTNLMRGAAFFFGTIFILVGIWFLSREVRESKA